MGAQFNVNLANALDEYPLDTAWKIQDHSKRNAISKQLLKAGATKCQPAVKTALINCCEEWLQQEHDPQLHACLKNLRQVVPKRREEKSEHDIKACAPATMSTPSLLSSMPWPSHSERKSVKQKIETAPKAKSLAGLTEDEQMALLSTSCHEILPNLYVGDYNAYRQINSGKTSGFAAAIKVTAQRHTDPLQKFFYAPAPSTLNLVDIGTDLSDEASSWPLLKSRLPQAFIAIDKALQAKQKVLVFCTQGVSRSPTIILAYLVSRYVYSPIL